MSLEENKNIIRRFVEAVNKHDVALLDELISPDFSYPSHQIRGLEIMKLAIEEEIKGFPDFHVTIEDIIAEGDKVWIRVEETGAHNGEYRGFAPTGKKITYMAVAIFRIVDGKVTEGWGVYDYLDFYKKLGVIEYRGFPDEIS